MKHEERIVEVMGTTAHVIVTGGPAGLVDRAVDRLDELEGRWSRFRSESEISRLNERAGVPVMVSRDTYALIEHALEGWRLTEGRFDPTLLPEVRAAGYDRSFELINALDAPQGQASPAPHDGRALDVAPADRPGAERIQLDPIVGTVCLGHGVQIDPGGIGKGFAADLVVELLLTAGALGALVNVGGDLRVSGSAPEGEGWIVAIDDPNDADHVIGTMALQGGAVASSWRTKRGGALRTGRRAIT